MFLSPSFTQLNIGHHSCSGKLILAKCVHSENEKEEEEHFFVSNFASLACIKHFHIGEGGRGLVVSVAKKKYC